MVSCVCEKLVSRSSPHSWRGNCKGKSPDSGAIGAILEAVYPWWDVIEVLSWGDDMFGFTR